MLGTESEYSIRWKISTRSNVFQGYSKNRTRTYRVKKQSEEKGQTSKQYSSERLCKNDILGITRKTGRNSWKVIRLFHYLKFRSGGLILSVMCKDTSTCLQSRQTCCDTSCCRKEK